MKKDGDRSGAVRVWTWLDLDDVKSSLMLIDDLYGTCANCKQIGLNMLKDRTCPACRTVFKYVATRLQNPGEIIKIHVRIQAEKLPLTIIDRQDYERASARDSLGNLFS